ncbi:M61 family metallopeptidase [Hymenobacter jeollabukensis]|uniref:M61 family metallopeptidase n=1 Tax=Hymenobacter jeollabukensis TaxID=2025313 RepID=A0A5R8WKX6_9BACT|nr:PDZ domain-containing protein [Hymenobacter jeollabukensis]TLM89494.1 M61 family metallopeptidase [Hymenobacter jeollabukensis]
MPYSSAARLLLGLGLLAAPLTVSAQQTAAPVQYRISFPNAVHHEAQVVAQFSQVPAGQPLHVRMARSSPGRYALHEFAKNVYDVKATDAQGRPLPLTHPDPYGWDVTPGADGTVRLSYTLYGDRTDGTYAGIDAQHAHLNIPATFAYARGLEQRPIRVAFEQLPADWKVATQLLPVQINGAAVPGQYEAPHLQYFMDSPTSLGAQQVRSWQEAGQQIELQVLHRGSEADLDRYAELTKKVVTEARAVFGELPAYDFGRYTFVADYLPQASGDGMEHRNSTSVTSPHPISGPGALDNLGTVSHEFFHSWNVERIRPRDLEPFDFERANMSDMLWFAEGFTQYYGELVMRRSGAYATDQQYCEEALTGLVNAMEAPGAKRYGAIYMSQQAPFVDAAKSIDPSNRANTYQSYYPLGGANALALDLTLRQRYRTTLDQYMRLVWQQHGQPQKDYAPARPYTVPDLQRLLGQVSGDTAFAGQFFRQHIYSAAAAHDYAKLLAPAGLLVRPVRPTEASLGLPGQIGFSNGRFVITFNTQTGTPLYQAGLDRDDEILRFDGKELKKEADLAKALKKHKVGDTAALEVRSRGQVRTVQVPLTASSVLEVLTLEKAGQQPSAEQLAFRTSWLGTQVK